MKKKFWKIWIFSNVKDFQKNKPRRFYITDNENQKTRLVHLVRLIAPTVSILWSEHGG